jgi:plastocyanin domain-containing protein
MTLRWRLKLVTVVLASFAFVTGCKDKGGGTSTRTSTGTVQVRADESGFKPSSVTFKKGAPASLVFTRTSDDTCATEVVFPELNVKKDLPKGKPVTIEIPTDKDQQLTFQCGMGMYKSAVVIN